MLLADASTLLSDESTLPSVPRPWSVDATIGLFVPSALPSDASSLQGDAARSLSDASTFP